MENRNASKGMMRCCNSDIPKADHFPITACQKEFYFCRFASDYTWQFGNNVFYSILVAINVVEHLQNCNEWLFIKGKRKRDPKLQARLSSHRRGAGNEQTEQTRQNKHVDQETGKNPKNQNNNNQ